MSTLYKEKVDKKMDSVTRRSYCKRANIRGGFNFAMFAVDIFSAKLKSSRSFYNTSVYTCM